MQITLREDILKDYVELRHSIALAERSPSQVRALEAGGALQPGAGRANT